MDNPTRFRCPSCEEEVEVSPESAGQLVRCPYCNAEFFASHEQSHLPVVDDTPLAVTEPDRESAFDKLRIENYTALRMGAIRARSWWLIGLCLSGVVVLDMLGKSVIYVWVFHHWGIDPTLRIIAAAASAVFARHAYHRAAEFKREIDHSAIPEPAAPPDFSTLQNGSEQWKNLENIR
jgi:DNA-directed RNA polymerase subunit RPC12/RpoP